MKIITKCLNEARNVHLTGYLLPTGGEFQSVTKRPVILVLPGGGYQFCSDREADPVAMAYLQAGYHVFILKYSVAGDSVWPNPLNDYEEAMEMIQSNAREWNLMADKVAVIGFSAGGHLAASAATIGRIKPAAAILGYAVMNDDVKMCNPSAPNVVEAVDYTTCPCFIFSTRDDGVVPILNSIQMMEALSKYYIAFESHIYAYGPHGFSTGNSSLINKNDKLCNRASDWVRDSILWLKDILGDYQEDGLSEPVCRPRTRDDGAEFLSVDCSMGVLYSISESAEIVQDILSRADKLNAIAQDTSVADNDILKSVMQRMTFRELLTFSGMQEDEICEVNGRLNNIKNIRM